MIILCLRFHNHTFENVEACMCLLESIKYFEALFGFHCQCLSHLGLWIMCYMCRSSFHVHITFHVLHLWVFFFGFNLVHRDVDSIISYNVQN